MQFQEHWALSMCNENLFIILIIIIINQTRCLENFLVNQTLFHAKCSQTAY